MPVSLHRLLFVVAERFVVLSKRAVKTNAQQFFSARRTQLFAFRLIVVLLGCPSPQLLVPLTVDSCQVCIFKAEASLPGRRCSSGRGLFITIDALGSRGGRRARSALING